VIFSGDFSFVKIFLTKLSCYHDNYFKYFMFGKYNGFVSKASGFCMHVFSSISLSGTHQRKVTVAFNNIHVAVDLVSFHLYSL
jgi:hypothetical protein